jgi:peptidoglycan/LPS O-acetylase OafA/YrhL
MGVGQRSSRIDTIRGVSILLVLFHHFVIIYRLDDTTLARVAGVETIRAVARNGNYGVTMFFVVSGFLITSNARRRWGDLRQVEVRSFYLLRIARIVPCLVLLLLIVDALALEGFRVFQNGPPEGSVTGSVPYWLSHLAALTSWMNVLVGHDGWFNYPLGVLWSLSVEEAFYFSFPLACTLLRAKARLAAFWATFIILGPAWRLTHQSDEGGWLYAYLACFDGIAIGCCTALTAERVSLRGMAATIVGIVVIIGMGGLYLAKPIAETNAFGVSLMAAGTGFLLLSAYSNQGRPPRRLDIVPWFGRLSYELYLFHLVVLGGMRTIWPARAVMGDAKLLLLAGYISASAVVAFILAHSYSDPLNRKLRSLLAARSSPAQAAAARGG